jgi:hypothetical protein
VSLNVAAATNPSTPSFASWGLGQTLRDSSLPKQCRSRSIDEDVGAGVALGRLRTLLLTHVSGHQPKVEAGQLLINKGDEQRGVPIAPPLVPILDDYPRTLRPGVPKSAFLRQPSSHCGRTNTGR